jgi:hypothetical protein
MRVRPFSNRRRSGCAGKEQGELPKIPRGVYNDHPADFPEETNSARAFIAGGRSLLIREEQRGFRLCGYGRGYSRALAALYCARVLLHPQLSRITGTDAANLKKYQVRLVSMLIWFENLD